MLIEIVWTMEVNPVTLNYILKVNSYSKPLLFYVLSFGEIIARVR